MTADPTSPRSGSRPRPRRRNRDRDRVRPSVWWLAWQVRRHEPRKFWAGGLAFVVFLAIPVGSGWILSRAVEQAGAGRVGATVRLAAVLAGAEAVRLVLFGLGLVWFLQAWEIMRSVLRGNMLAAQLASGGVDAGRPVASTGEATARFRDDTEDISWFIDTWIDLAGAFVFATVALTVLATIDARATAVLLAPMLTVGLVASLLGRRLQDLHRADRVAAGEVTALLGDVLAAPATIEVNGAAEPVLARLESLLDDRLGAVVRSKVAQDVIRSISHSTADIGLGLVLLVVAGSVAAGRFDLGDIALFATYGAFLGFPPRMLGLLLARRHQATVAFDGMRRLVADDDPANLVQARPFRYDRTDPGPAPTRGRSAIAIADSDITTADSDITTASADSGHATAADGSGWPGPLATVELRGLGHRHPDGAGVSGVDLTINRGTLTVVTGPVGAGKSTLLRAVLGLTPAHGDQGEVRWNGRPVADRAAVLVPPRAAWVPQVPRLLSDSLADNVLLGADPERLVPALEAAEVADEVAAMAGGAGTVVGPRGVRLSGGQRQRVAAARALAGGADLLVVDDLSSALDVETEVRLWANLARAGVTVLAVSNRPVALDRADQVVRLDGGVVVEVVGGPGATPAR